MGYHAARRRGVSMAEGISSHSGHRDRLRDRARRFGLETLEDHEILEMLLYCVLPRRNTNPLAHQLIAEFGSLGAVIGAPTEQLRRAGLNKRGAFWLHYLADYLERYMSHFVSEDTDNERVCQKVLDQVRRELADAPEGEALAVMLDSSGNIIRVQHFGPSGKSPISVKAVCLAAADAHAYYAVTAQMYGENRLCPNEQDCQLTAAYYNALKAMGVKLLDRVFVTPYFSRSFYEMGAFFKTTGDFFSSEYYSLLRKN